MKKFLSLSVILLVGVCLLSSCSKQSPLIGKWTNNGGISVLEFCEDGKVKFSGPFQAQGTWSELGDGKLQIQIDGYGFNDLRGMDSYEIRGRELRIFHSHDQKGFVLTKQ